MTFFRVTVTCMALLIAGLTLASIALLTAASHDAPLHRAYACEFAKDFRLEVHLPPAPCSVRTP